MFLSLILAGRIAVAQAAFPAGVIATGTQGVTNPPVPTLPTIINQNSVARLVSVQSIDDFCIFAPPDYDEISNTEEVEVAWCTQPRNNARVIPDGVITGVSFLKTDFYVQIYGFGDFEKLNIKPGDGGGELDPHGATGAGNPVGGNVTSTVADGVDEAIAEWMLYIDQDFFCMRACISANSTYSAAFMCWHELDEMGCEFVMPGTYYYQGGIFETCDADVAYPPGWYPEVTNGTTSFSTFAQYFTGVYTGGDGKATPYTVGDTVTPTAPYSTPKSSNCVTQATISNGIPAASLTAGAQGTALPPGFASSTPLAHPTSVVASGSASVSGNNSTISGPTASSLSPSSTTSGGSSTRPGALGPSTTGAGTGSRASSPSTTSAGSNDASRTRSGGEFLGIALMSVVAGLGSISLLH
ncbi:hypothetical protein C8F04DRAFT_1107404 [Mycena alexandri]|uniref:Uncharacterized protein n=1 Tax=Mycena alexandri TaxID=1745969 RepID=A0AAD6X503_9AGAR|nr:hypothetical protein C8F04DRAFT_1107404 [Mycena alexandri]